MAPPRPGQTVLPPNPIGQSPVLGQTGDFHPSSSSLLIKLVCKALTSALIFIALIILTTNNTSARVLFYPTCTFGHLKIKFYSVFAYRYMLFIILLALVYSLLQTAFSIFHLTSNKRVHRCLAVLDFYGDLVLLYALATAAAAGFGASVDLQLSAAKIKGIDMREFHGKGNATASMIFFASICTAVSLILSK